MGQGDFESGKFSTLKKKFFLQNCKNWNILQRCKFFFSKKCHPSRGILKGENFPLKKKKLQIARIGTFCRGAKKKKSKKCHPSRGILKVENFPLQIFFFLQNCKNWNILQRCNFFFPQKMSS